MSDGMRKVTALVPSYNHGNYIRERILSIINQTYSNIELIVIDDHSTDGSHAIISEMQAIYRFTYLRNRCNSGSPFSAWEAGSKLANGDYIWVCESDDVAHPRFLETAISALQRVPQSVIFYCSSQITDERGAQIGHTDSYFREIWRESRWERDFVVDGFAELVQFQLRGQTVPNMSSAVFDAAAFRTAFKPSLKRLRLAGDWLFVGEVMRHGKVVFSRETLNQFRKHDVTCRVRVSSARSQAEFIMTKYRLFRASRQSTSVLASLIAPDAVRFLHEPDSWWGVLRALLKISVVDTLRFSCALFVSIRKNYAYFEEFKKRYNLLKKTEHT